MRQNKRPIVDSAKKICATNNKNGSGLRRISEFWTAPKISFLNPIGIGPFGADRCHGRQIYPPHRFSIFLVFWPLWKIALKEHINIGKTTKKRPPIFKNKKVMSI